MSSIPDATLENYFKAWNEPNEAFRRRMIDPEKRLGLSMEGPPERAFHAALREAAP